jgi:choline dehydrogenase-like flavoprotein
MSHLAFQNAGQDVALEVDYVVVGSGAGGATAACTLARGGAQVALVEAGPWRDPDDYPHSAYGSMRDLFDDWGSLVTRGRALWPIVQAGVVGGTTVINSAIAVRTPGDVFARWQRETGAGGALAEALWRHQDELEQELHVEQVPAVAMGRAHHLAVLGGAALAMDGHSMKRYSHDCVGAGTCLQGCHGRRKQSANLNFVPEVLARGGHVLSCAPVKRVQLEGRRAVGVQGRFRDPGRCLRGGKFSVRARRGVVVAASATHSPALLLRSGVRSRALGQGFRAHPGSGVFGCYDQPVDMNQGVTQGWATTKFRDTPGLKLETLSIPFEMVAGRLAGGGSELMERIGEYRHFAMWVHAVRAESVGTVANGSFDKPVVRYTLDRPDMERFREGTYLVAKLHFAAGARAIIPGIHGLPYKMGPDQLEQLRDAPLDPRRYIAILSHLFGGCTLGADPDRSVCDEQGRVHGYQQLYVADASVIPSNLGVNPQHTIMALARHFAHRMLDDPPSR